MMDTPRTDAEVFDHEDYDSHPTMVLTARVVPADFARGLERELAEARRVLESLYHDHPAGLCGSTSCAYEAAKIYLNKSAIKQAAGEVESE